MPPRNTSVVVVSGGGNELGIINTTETRNPVSYEWTKAKPDTDRQLKPEYLNNAGVANSRRAGVAISENGVVYQVLRTMKLELHCGVSTQS